MLAKTMAVKAFKWGVSKPRENRLNQVVGKSGAAHSPYLSTFDCAGDIFPKNASDPLLIKRTSFPFRCTS